MRRGDHDTDENVLASGVRDRVSNCEIGFGCRGNVRERTRPAAAGLIQPPIFHVPRRAPASPSASDRAEVLSSVANFEIQQPP